tara:strand:- start:95 stop:691 length:597 start_codon:yes stop_codon:yes gene_type:complete
MAGLMAEYIKRKNNYKKKKKNNRVNKFEKSIPASYKKPEKKVNMNPDDRGYKLKTGEKPDYKTPTEFPKLPKKKEVLKKAVKKKTEEKVEKATPKKLDVKKKDDKKKPKKLTQTKQVKQSDLDNFVYDMDDHTAMQKNELFTYDSDTHQDLKSKPRKFAEKVLNEAKSWKPGKYYKMLKEKRKKKKNNYGSHYMRKMK